MGLGVGTMLTPSVNVVQSALPGGEAGRDLRALARVSNLGSSMGTAIAGTIVVADAAAGNTLLRAAMIVLAGIALIGLLAAIMLPRQSAAR